MTQEKGLLTLLTLPGLNLYVLILTLVAKIRCNTNMLWRLIVNSSTVFSQYENRTA